MDRADIEYLALVIAQAVRDAVSGLTVSVDGSALGYIAANAINKNREADGRMSLDL